MADPFISICIPVFNGEAYIREAVESALAQDYTNFEVNVCENVSTDRTREVLEELEHEGNHRLKIRYCEDHVPLASNLNRAARMATAPYVIVLSADDILMSDALKVLSGKIKSFPDAEVFIGRAAYLIEGGGRVLDRGIYRHDPGPVEDFESFTVANPFPVNINSMLLRSEIAFFREDCGVVTDLDMMIRFGIERRSVVLLEEKLIHYRVHDGATSANRIKMFRESLEVYRKYLRLSSRPDLYRKRVFRTLFWCAVFLIDARQRDEARNIIRNYRDSINLLQSIVLRLALMPSWNLSHMEKIRTLRGRLIGANG
jgi:glycosyltransferase involved in cell wall biosynthesis